MAQLAYGTMGRQGLSYSRRETLHTCARKFELAHALGLSERTNSVTFAFGHSVAAGVQGYLNHGSRELAIVQAAAAYDFDWSNPGTVNEQKAKKNVWYAIEAVELFIMGMKNYVTGLGELTDYEILTFNFNGKATPAVELEFKVELDYDYVYEGHIDLILRNKKTGRWVIVELKTTRFSAPHDAMYKNSDQALSYSIVLDKVVETFGDADTVPDYEVIYCIYSSSAKDWFVKKFPKSVAQRFNWINNLLRDVELIESYHEDSEEGIPYPTNGSSCFNFFNPCEFFGKCEYSNANLLRLHKPQDSQFAEKDNVHFTFTIAEILAKQAALAQERAGITVSVPSEI